MPDANRDPVDFLNQAEEPAPGIIREFVDFLRDNRKWWLVPILLMLSLLGLFAALSTTALAPFIYPLF